MAQCRRWAPEIKRLWKRAEGNCEWGGPRAPSVRLLFRDAKATPALLEFLEDTRVGRMSGRVLLARGPDLDEEVVEGWSYGPRRRRRSQTSVVRRRTGQAVLLGCTFSFVFFFCLAEMKASFSFSFVRRVMGRRSSGIPHYDCASWSGVALWFERLVGNVSRFVS